VWGNYDLIQREFADVDFAASLPRDLNLPPNLNAPSQSDRPDIDAWLLHYAAVVSEAQLQYATTNEHIPVVGPTRVAYRPPRYGRALVVPLQDTWPNGAYLDPEHRPEGLFDVKGCGVAVGQVPSCQLHRSGLLALPIALGELVAQLVIERIFEYLQVDVRGVGIYAILDLGFLMKGRDGSLMPAGAIIRRAHQRPAGNIERPDYDTEPHRIKLALEFMLRRFGVTSCAPVTQFRIWREEDGLHCSYAGTLDRIPSAGLKRFLKKMSLQAPVDFDMTNVQLVRGATLTPLSAVLVDFGQFDFAIERFMNPLACFVQKRPMHWGGFIDSTSRYWVQPNPEISIDKTLAGGVPTPSWIPEWVGGTSPEQTNGLFLFAAELVRDLTLRGATRREIQNRICKIVESATQKLSQAPNIAEMRGRHRQTGAPNSESVNGVTDPVEDALAHVDGFLAQNALRWACRTVSGLSTPDRNPKV